VLFLGLLFDLVQDSKITSPGSYYVYLATHGALARVRGRGLCSDFGVISAVVLGIELKTLHSNFRVPALVEPSGESSA
jgi:hypothetical protein